MGVGLVLSQSSGEPSKLHPCAYFSCKLSPLEQNYDIGNRELLAIKLALEEWRHCMEGAIHNLQVITDHRNLEYLRETDPLGALYSFALILWSPTNLGPRIPVLTLSHISTNPCKTLQPQKPFFLQPSL